MPFPKRALLPIVALAWLLGLGVPLPVEPAAAAAAPEGSCAKAVVDDWYGNSRVDRRYPLHCYREAIASLSTDQKDYLHAEEDILRALAYARKGKPDPGVAPSSTATNGDEAGPTTPSNRPVHPQKEDGTSETVAADELRSDEAASVPLPLILLGGLALVLLAAGGVGVVSRRLGETPGGDDD